VQGVTLSDGAGTTITGGNITTNAINSGNITSTGTITDGGLSITNNGNLSTAGSITSNGANFQNNIVTGIASGSVTATSTDAVNGSQLYTLQQNLANVQTAVNGLIASGLCTTNNGRILCGSGAQAKYPDSLAIGANAQALGDPTVALGANSQAIGNNSVAVGYNAVANGTNSVALGANSVANRANSVSVGDSASGLVRQITNVAPGTLPNDAVNMTQLRGVGAMALAAVEATGQAQPGKTSLGFGVATLGGQEGIAVGLAHTPKGMRSLTLRLSIERGGNQTGVAGGFSIQF
jgi:autotransporter adhesin